VAAGDAERAKEQYVEGIGTGRLRFDGNVVGDTGTGGLTSSGVIHMGQAGHDHCVRAQHLRFSTSWTAWPRCPVPVQLQPEGRQLVAEADNKGLMQTLDDAWNAQDWETFVARHAEDTIVHWPGQTEPTRGVYNHKAESIDFFKTFDNKLDNRPYRVLIAEGDWTCSIARWTGKMIGPMKAANGETIRATNKTFELEFCTVARWKDGKIVEENLFYDQLGLMHQIGVQWR
jgi:ketosteroid isomerase-like protein